jgi:hydroxymethylbilane synthase
MPKTIIIGSRKSALAIIQAKILMQELKKHYPRHRFILKHIISHADRLKSTPLKELSVTGAFVKELETALLQRKIDIAVHSAKDLPINLPGGLAIPCILKRENPYDVLIAKDKLKLKDLPRGARIGTSSLRRIAQLKKLRSDLRFVEMRGNLETRIQKIFTKKLDGVILAYAGVRRLGLKGKISEVLKILPCTGQGALAAESRNDRPEIQEMLLSINHKLSFQEIVAERALLQGLGGGCNVPIGCLARASRNNIVIEGLVCSVDGQILIRHTLNGSNTNAEELGRRLADILLEKGADKLLWQR